MTVKVKRDATPHLPGGDLFILSDKMIDQKYFEIVKNKFNGNEKEAWEWFQHIHPKLGMLTPLNMIALGKSQKLIKLIESEMR